MKKRYRVLVHLDNGRVIHGPFLTENDFPEWIDLLGKYNEFDVFRMTDGFRRVIIPKELIQRSYVEIRRASLIRALIANLWRFVTK